MAIEVRHEPGDNVLDVSVSGTLTREDYERFTPEAERVIAERGAMRVVFDMHDFHGWDAGALWEDTKFALHHFRDIERLAIIGESRWEKGMANFCKPFTRATIRYFERGAAAEARRWVRESEEV